MIITADTKFVNLHQEGIVSIRTVNALANGYIYTVSDLINYISSGKELLSIRNFGAKSYHEIRELLDILDLTFQEIREHKQLISFSYNTSEEKAFDDAFKQTNSNNNAVEMVIKSKYKDSKQLKFLLSCDYEKMIEVIPSLSMSENIYYRKYYIDLLTNFKSLIDSKSTFLQQDLYSRINFLIDNCEHFSYSEISKYFLTNRCKNYIQTKFMELCSKRLSRRAINFINDNIKTYDVLVALFDKPFDQYLKLAPGKSLIKTLTEIYHFNNEFKELFISLYLQTDTSLISLELKDKYPFLSSKQRKFVYDYYTKYNIRPLFYILYNYLHLANNRDDQLYSLHFGIFDNTPRDFATLSAIFDLSYERIRQIVNGKVTAFNQIIDNQEESKQYLKLFDSSFICKYSTSFTDLKNKEHIDCNFLAFVGLGRLILPYSIFYLNSDNPILIKNDLCKQINLKNIIIELENLIKGKYREDTTINLYDEFSYIPKDILVQIIPLLRYIVLLFYGIKTSCDANIFMRQNYIDIDYELYLILEQNKSPMHIDDIFISFKQKYPHHKFEKSNQLRSYLYKSDKIASIGKSSTYALLTWDNVYFGNIRTLLIDILDSSENPVHIDVLMNKVLEFYPETNIHSITSTMQSDTHERFVAFENGYFGLSSKEYDELYQPSQKYSRISFEERIKSFQQFVEKYQRFPNGSGGEAEASLQRWYYNIINHIIELTNPRRLVFDEMVDSYKNSGFPRSQTENEFRNNCCAYKEFVYENHCRPSSTFGLELYNWFRRSQSNYKGYSDQRYDYFIKLLVDLDNLLI